MNPNNAKYLAEYQGNGLYEIYLPSSARTITLSREEITEIASIDLAIKFNEVFDRKRTKAIDELKD